MIKVLTVHPAASGASRLIPLFVLQKRYIGRYKNIKNSFLVPKKYHKELTNSGIAVLDIDNSVNFDELNNFLENKDSKNSKDNFYNGLKIKDNIYKAIKNLEYDIVIEDFEPYTVLPCKTFNIPRISIHRTGQFRSLPLNLRNSNHMHSCEKSSFNTKQYDASVILGSKKINIENDVNLLSHYPNADAKIIPGIPSIEVLPDDIKNRESYFYSGPLNVEDKPSTKMIEELTVFFKNNKANKTVFITTGLVDRTSIEELIIILLDEGYSVISTIQIQVVEKYKGKYLHNKMFPLNYICSKVSLIVHQCGSGIYHYPILNEKAVITLGTQCYDREDVAVRLEQMGVSKHVPHPFDNDNYLKVFKKHLKSFEENELCNFKELKKLKEEIYSTMLSFDIREVIDYVFLERKNKKKI